MDTTTVLEIIKMLDVEINKSIANEAQDIDYAVGYELGLIRFRDHLQGYIEAQLNAAENNTGE
jgi:non-canonical (house-cleaning) NTP pyrophosphatase